jgi:hypothetical protein
LKKPTNPSKGRPIFPRKRGALAGTPDFLKKSTNPSKERPIFPRNRGALTRKDARFFEKSGRSSKDARFVQGIAAPIEPDFEEKPLAGGTRRANLPVI